MSKRGQRRCPNESHSPCRARQGGGKRHSDFRKPRTGVGMAGEETGEPHLAGARTTTTHGPCRGLGMTLGDSWVDLGSQETTRDAWWRMARREGTRVLELEHPAVIGERWWRLGEGSDRSLIRGHPRGRAKRTGKISLQIC